MEATAHRAERLLLRRRLPVDVLPAIGAWTLGAALVGYLAMANGGYDTIIRGQVGIAVWWIVLVGAAVGALPGPLTRAAWAAIALLVALTGFALLSATWSESAERTVADVAKLATYAGVLVLGISAQRRGQARHLAGGVACAIAVVGVLALLSRLHPSWFPRNDQVVFLGNTSRLAYPLNYWNGLAAFVAMGIPLLLAVAGSARRIVDAGRSGRSDARPRADHLPDELARRRPRAWVGPSRLPHAHQRPSSPAGHPRRRGRRRARSSSSARGHARWSRSRSCPRAAAPRAEKCCGLP